MKLSAEEASWLYEWLQEHGKKMPSSRQFQPYDIAKWQSPSSIFHAFRENAIKAPDIIWKSVCDMTKSGKWPKMKSEYAFWLRERWQMAERYCWEVSDRRIHSASAIAATPPKDAQAATKWLLLELWNSRLAEVWARQNLRTYLDIDPYSPQEYQMDVEIYLRKLESS